MLNENSVNKVKAFLVTFFRLIINVFKFKFWGFLNIFNSRIIFNFLKSFILIK